MNPNLENLAQPLKTKLSKAPRVRTMPIIGDQPNTKSPMKKRTAVTMNPLGADTSKHSTFAVNP